MEGYTKSKEIVTLEKKIEKISVDDIKIVDEPTMLVAGDRRRELKEFLKQAKEEKEAATKPLNGVLKTIRGWFAPMEEKLGNAINSIESKMNAYNEKIEADRRKAEREAQAKIDEARRKEEAGKITEKQAEKIVEKAEAKVESAPAAVTSSNSFHTRVDRKVKFTDLIHLTSLEIKSLIQGGYLVWDEVKGRRDALSGSLTVGVEIYEQKSLI